MRGLALIGFSLLSIAPACVIAPPDGGRDPGYDYYDPSPSPAPSPSPFPSPSPASPTARGAYEVRSMFDITAAAVLPQPAYDLVETLHDFSTAPAHTLLDLAEDAGVPAVSELRAALPDSIESRLEGWIDDRIEAVTINGVPVTQVAGDIAALGETTLTQFAIDSTLDVGTDGHAAHRLVRLDFTPAGLDVRVPVGQLPGDIVAANLTATASHGTLALSAHDFGLPYGHYAWQALEAGMTAQYGAGVRGLLGAAVNCPAVADAVANKCAFGVCVGHRSQLLEICERGLDEVVNRARDKFEAQRFDAIRFDAGTATLAAPGTNGIATRLDGGVWTAKIDAGLGLRRAPATFTGAR
jgi:hypothetical protein